MELTLLTMGAGNVIVLEETFRSFSKVCNEIIYGDLLLFPEDREILHSYKLKYNLKIVEFPFDFIFKNGFSAILNELSPHATNDMCVYANTSEIIEEDFGIEKAISGNPYCNMFFFTHETDPHRWFRTYDRRNLKWSGLIHESVVGDERPYHKSIFQMADLEKDLMNPFKARVLNDVKEIVYFTNYMRIIDEPNMLGGTDPGWVHFAEANYESMAYRLRKKGKRYEAFKNGDYIAYMNAVYTDPEFQVEKFESSDAIEFQGDPRYLGKK